MTQRLKDFRTQELKKTTRFAGVNVIRLSKCSRESVEEQVRTAPKQNLNIQNKMRKAKPKKRVILPDPVFNDQKVSKFVNHLMYDGKKSKS